MATDEAKAARVSCADTPCSRRREDVGDLEIDEVAQFLLMEMSMFPLLLPISPQLRNGARVPEGSRMFNSAQFGSSCRSTGTEMALSLFSGDEGSNEPFDRTSKAQVPRRTEYRRRKSRLTHAGSTPNRWPTRKPTVANAISTKVTGYDDATLYNSEKKPSPNPGFDVRTQTSKRD
jgi:hypothetical protein